MIPVTQGVWSLEINSGPSGSRDGLMLRRALIKVRILSRRSDKADETKMSR